MYRKIIQLLTLTICLFALAVPSYLRAATYTHAAEDAYLHIRANADDDRIEKINMIMRAFSDALAGLDERVQTDHLTPADRQVLQILQTDVPLLLNNIQEVGAKETERQLHKQGKKLAELLLADSTFDHSIETMQLAATLAGIIAMQHALSKELVSEEVTAEIASRSMLRLQGPSMLLF